MKARWSALALVVLAAVSGCADHSTAPPKPFAIVLAGGSGQVATVGQTVPVTPTFTVTDQNGAPIAGVPVAIAVTAGGGALLNAPRTTSAGPTSVGTWSLGPKPGANELTVTVGTLLPLVIKATANVGAAARLVPLTTAPITGRVTERASPSAQATVVDGFGNPIPNATVTVTTRAGSGATAPATVTSDAQGNVTVDNWILGTVAGQDVLTLSIGTVTTSFIATVAPGDPASLSVVSGDQQRGRAGAPLAAPIVLRVVDRFGNGVGGQLAAVTVTGGNGTVSSTSPTSAADGSITIPSWTLGRIALPQVLHVVVGSAAADVSASVQTDYQIDVRFFGPEPSDAQRALFMAAAARVSAVVTGDVQDVTIAPIDLEQACGVPGLPTFSGKIDDLVIYATVDAIDGPGGIIAASEPCVFRNSSLGNLTAIGVIALDIDDIDFAALQGTLQDVMTHEMLHVLGIGTLWDVKALLAGAGTPDVAYLGVIARQGCLEDGGTAACVTTVPVQNSGGPGTADSHWRESVFRNELMTPYVDLGGMPFSSITVGALTDLGYTVNPLAADPFKVPGGGGGVTPNLVPGKEAWEKLLPPGMVVLTPDGRAVQIKRP